MMLTPCWPSAGPTGGAGLALPAWICSLIVVRTFLAIEVEESSGLGLDLLYLVVADLDRRLATEDRHQHLEFGGILVDLGDLAGEIRQGAGDDFDRLADRELGLSAGALRRLTMQEPVDLGFGQ